MVNPLPVIAWANYLPRQLFINTPHPIMGGVEGLNAPAWNAEGGQP